jgi:hypothetical protein
MINDKDLELSYKAYCEIMNDFNQQPMGFDNYKEHVKELYKLM